MRLISLRLQPEVKGCIPGCDSCARVWGRELYFLVARLCNAIFLLIKNV